MKFFVDTADVKEIKELNDLGLLDGVTETHGHTVTDSVHGTPAPLPAPAATR